MNYFPALYQKLLGLLKDPAVAKIMTALITGAVLVFSLVMGMSIFRGCQLNGMI